MKNMSKKKLIVIILIAIIIIAGITITLTKGLNYDLRYQETKKVELYLGKNFAIADIKQITDEVLPNQAVLIQKIEVYEDYISIISKDITDEQKTNLVNKVNEKYETEFAFLKDVLMKNGVKEDAILKEDQATFTYENAKLSRKVTDAAGLQIKKAIICCKSYHARRSLMYYQDSYPETEFLVCPVCADGISRENWKNTLEGRQAVSGEISRIICQFPLML